MDTLTKQKVLVSGSRGYIGSCLTLQLQNKGYQVIESDFNAGLGDFRTITANDLAEIDTVIHLAGFSKTAESAEDIAEILELNLKATQQFAEVCKQAGVKHFLFTSSGFVYSSSQKGLANETNEVAVEEPYTRSKYDAEQMFAQIANADFKVTVCRLANVYGLSPNTRFDLVVNSLVCTAVYDHEMLVNAEPDLTISLIHVEDVASALTLLTGFSPKLNFDLYNVAPNHEYYSIQQLCADINKQLPQAKVEYLHKKPAIHMMVDGNKLLQSFPNFKYQWNLEKGIAELKAYCLTNSNKRPDK